MAKTPRTTAPPPRDIEKEESELRFRERQFAIQERELAIKERESQARVTDQARSRWMNPLVLAVFAAAIAAAGNAGVAYINGNGQRELERYKAEAQQAIEETKAEAARILEVIKTNDPDKAAENLDFLLKSGLIANTARRESIDAFLKQRQPGEGPSLPPQSQTGPPRPSYDIPIPPPPAEQTAAAARLLAKAVAELNADVDEASSEERIRRYLKFGMGKDVPGDVRQLPWSGAFLSWLIRESGNTTLPPTASNVAIWNAAKGRQLTYLPGEKQVLPGDIVILARTGVNLPELREGKALTSAHSGIVYATNDKGFSCIEANVQNAIHLRERAMTDMIVGFIRLDDNP